MGGLLGGCKGYVDPPLKLLGGGGGVAWPMPMITTPMITFLTADLAK